MASTLLAKQAELKRDKTLKEREELEISFAVLVRMLLRQNKLRAVLRHLKN